MEQETVVKAVSEPRKWRGYTIDELEQRRVVNQVKCDLVKEQFGLVYKSAQASLMSGGSGMPFEEQINKVVTYATYGVQIYRYAKDIFGLFKSASR
ncbi:MAG: hypothetical protein HDR82_02905 [Bacteroides sp.]|nr:hypothetical protein [Bacteroides sp.]